RYGFEESAQGVKEAMFEYARMSGNNLVIKRNNHMERLIAAGEDIDYYNGVSAQQSLRNFGTRRPVPQNQFPLVAREEFQKSVEGRLLPVPRHDMLSAQRTEELVGACKRGDLARAKALLDQGSCLALNVGFQGLGMAVKVLAQALGSPQTLELDISGNCLGPEGAKALAAGVPQALKVLRLNVARNRLTLEGVRSIAASLPSGLEELALGFAGMKTGPAGAAALAEKLPQVTKLSLDLAGNQMGDDGLECISKALPKSLELLHVVLLGNNLSRRGFFMIDRQIGDPLHEHHLPKLQPENFVKVGEVEVTEFKEQADTCLKLSICFHTLSSNPRMVP
ncbi:unnamed protein product, partial [Effrenium voratum]